MQRIHFSTRGTRRRLQALISCLLAMVVLTSGCRTVTLGSAFEPEPPLDSMRPSSRISELVVRSGPDARPLGGRSSIGPGFLSWIPLVPYGHQQIAPEFGAMAASLESESLQTDLMTVITQDLQRAGVADRVAREGMELSNLGGAGADKASEAHVLKLTLDEGIYHRNLTLYGVSLAGALLWMVGFPNSYGSADLAITAELFDPSGQSLGKASFAEKSRATEWLYRPMGPAYSRAMPRAYRAMSPALRDFVAKHLSGRAGARQAR